jgi:hypothetical protein
MPLSDVRLVRDGYTISNPTATFGPIGKLYVMRDHEGHRVELPVDTTKPDHLREVWGAFKHAAAGNEPMLATLFGEIVWSGSRAYHRARTDLRQ